MIQEDWSYKFYKFSLLTFLMFISALNYNLFINPAKIVAGGVNGISTILERLFYISPSSSMIIIYILMLVIVIFFKEYELAISALFASIIYPFFVEITSSLNGIINFSQKDLLIIAIFSGIISGIISGLTCKLNISQGGTILIAQVICKELKTSASKINTIISMVIVISGGFVFGITNILLAIVFLFSSKIIMDKITLGISKNKLFHIITNRDDDVIEYITKNLDSGVTTFKTRGGYEHEKRTVIMSCISSRDYFKLKEGVKSIDENSFMVITDAYQVRGGK